VSKLEMAREADRLAAEYWSAGRWTLADVYRKLARKWRREA